MSPEFQRGKIEIGTFHGVTGHDHTVVEKSACRWTQLFVCSPEGSCTSVQCMFLLFKFIGDNIG